jgi:hypothetical protein
MKHIRYSITAQALFGAITNSNAYLFNIVRENIQPYKVVIFDMIKT